MNERIDVKSNVWMHFPRGNNRIILVRQENHANKELMAAVTGALWKLSMSEDNVKTFQGQSF